MFISSAFAQTVDAATQVADAAVTTGDTTTVAAVGIGAGVAIIVVAAWEIFKVIAGWTKTKKDDAIVAKFDEKFNQLKDLIKKK